MPSPRSATAWPDSRIWPTGFTSIASACIYSFLFDSLSGPVAPGTKLNDVGYDITLAKTVTSPETPFLGNLTFILENYAQTDLDGSTAGRTLVTLTPGVRFNLGKSDGVKMGKDNWIMLGTDIPISNYHPWDAIYRFTYIKKLLGDRDNLGSVCGCCLRPIGWIAG